MNIRFSVLFALTACAGGDEPAATACADPLHPPPGVICNAVGVPGYAMLSADEVPPSEAAMYLPIDAEVAPDGRLFLIDWNNHRLRRLDDDGLVRSFAGTGFLGDGPPGPASGAAFNHPTNIKFHPDDPNTLYIAAWHNSRIEKIDLRTNELTFECGTGDRWYGGDGGPASEADLDLPSSIVFDDDGAILLSDTANQILRRIGTDGIITTFAGTAPPGLLPNGLTDRRYGWEGDGGDALAAKFNFGWGQRGYPGGRVEKDGRTLYIADTYNFVVRAMDLDTGEVWHVAGTGLQPGFDPANTDAATTPLAFPTDVAVDADGNLYIADTQNDCVRKVSPDGVMSTFAGICGEPGHDGDGGQATSAHLWNPYGVEAGDGVLYIADTENHVIRAVGL